MEIVRCLPSALRTHFSTAGLHAAIPQKSPTFFQRASGDSGDGTVMLDSNESAEAVETMRAAMAAITEFTRIGCFPPEPIVANVIAQSAAKPDKIARP